MISDNKLPRHVALTFPRTYDRIVSFSSRYEEPISRGLLIFTLISEILRISTYLFERGILEITIDLLPRKVLDRLKIDADFLEHVLIKILHRLESVNPTVILFEDSALRRIIFTNTEDKIFKLNIVVGYDYERELKRALEASIGEIANVNENDLTMMTLIMKGKLVIPGDPDLVIVFGDEKFPDFIPLNLAYSELSFIDKELAEVSRDDIDRVLEDYRRRSRRFGR
ncbi:MAG: hypothetical protein GXO23_03890 [Crenarchaeota archaeon]|nr:hypothetical protein [Thermoproteota archaeon]